MRLNLALYLGARCFGQTGHNLFTAMLFVIAGTGNHASLGLGTLLATTTIASVVLGVPGGALADRIGPGRGFAAGAALRCCAIALAMVLPTPAVMLIALAFSYTAISQLHNPAEMALVKVLSARQAGRIHSIMVAIQYGGQGMGFLVLAPALYFLGGVEAALAGALAIVAVQVLLAVLLAVRIRPLVENAWSENTEHEPAHRHRFAGLRETVSFFSHSEPARDALAVQALKSLVAQVIMVAFPLYLKQDLSLGTEGAIFLIVPGVAGAIAGLVWSGTGLTLDGTARAMRLSILGMAVAAFALAALDFGMSFAFTYSQVPPLVRIEAALNTTVIVAMPLAFLIGATLSVSMVAARLALTAAAPLTLQSRVFAMENTVSDALIVLPILFSGVIAEFLGARATLGSLGFLCLATWLLMWHPRFQLGFLARRANVADPVGFSQ
ncbi:MAG: MFS transporter [Dehalococcoidia bacterium]